MTRCSDTAGPVRRPRHPCGGCNPPADGTVLRHGGTGTKGGQISNLSPFPLRALFLPHGGFHPPYGLDGAAAVLAVRLFRRIGDDVGFDLLHPATAREEFLHGAGQDRKSVVRGKRVERGGRGSTEDEEY